MLSDELVLKGAKIRYAIHCVIIAATLVCMQEFHNSYEQHYIKSSSVVLQSAAMLQVLDKGFNDAHIFHQFQSNV